MIDAFGGALKNKATDAPEVQEFGAHMIDKIFAAAQPGAVFSAPVVAGAYTIVTASEVGAGGGFGFGSGSGPAQTSDERAGDGQTASGGGGGGGGGSFGRPVAAIVIGPDGVKVQPIVDTSKIAMAAIGAWLSIALLLVRRARARTAK